VGYLVDLRTSPFGVKYETAVAEPLIAAVECLRDAASFLGPADVATLGEAVDDLRRRVTAGGLPAEFAVRVTQQLDRLTGAAPRRAPARGRAKPRANKPVAAGDGLLRRRIAAGEFVFRQGDRGDEAYLIDRGDVEIILERKTGTVVLAIAGRGEIIGEMALIDRQPRMASARAKTDVMLVVIPEEALRARLDQIAETDHLIPLLLARFVERLRAQAHVTR